MASSRSVYPGAQRNLVLAFDVGTTYSSISYSVLDPGLVPEVRPVTRFPSQEHIYGPPKIPTIIYYDRGGKVRAVGAEAMREGIENENWVKAEWFKIYLQPEGGPGRNITPLPLNKTVVEVFADILRYLLECASSFIQGACANGRDLWISVKDQIAFVLSYPNGWEGTQQCEIRRAAILADLIPDTEAGHARLSFVTEGEASLHFSIQNGLPAGVMKDGVGAMIVHAGDRTIDVSSYSRDLNAAKETFEEIAARQRHFFGSICVSLHAELFLKCFLADSSYLDDLEHIVRSFDKTTKLRFREAEEPQYIKIGSIRDNDKAHSIRFGQLKLNGSDVASFFQPSVNCIVNAVLDQRKSTQKMISHVVLVGSLSASYWLFKKVEEALTPLGLTILRPESYVNIITDGAIYSYLTGIGLINFGHSFVSTYPEDPCQYGGIHNLKNLKNLRL